MIVLQVFSGVFLAQVARAAIIGAAYHIKCVKIHNELERKLEQGVLGYTRKPAPSFAQVFRAALSSY